MIGSPRILLLVGLIGSVTSPRCAAEDFAVFHDGYGPISVHMSLVYEGKGERLIATARNDSKETIPYVKLCVATEVKGCLFSLWNKVPWTPGMELSWDMTTQRKIGSLAHDVNGGVNEKSLAKADLARIPPPPVPPRPPSIFDPIKVIYVDDLAGSMGPILKEQIVAALVNSGRFSVVEVQSRADAILRGRSDDVDSGATQVTTSGRTTGAAYAGIAVAGGKTSSVTQRVVNEIASLRLTIPNGDIIWAWDGSKPCKMTKAQCAISDLVALAQR